MEDAQLAERNRNMKQFEYIFWDVDQTLLDFEKSEDYALSVNMAG